MIRPILLWPDPVLRQPAATVTAFDPDLAELIDDLFATMYDAPGRGLAAPQVGVLSRVCVVDAHWKTAEPRPVAMVNPEVLWRSETLVARDEACLSIPDQPRRVARPDSLVVAWVTARGEPREGRFSGAEATCVQHELDHLDGRVILDHAVAP